MTTWKWKQNTNDSGCLEYARNAFTIVQVNLERYTIYHCGACIRICEDLLDAIDWAESLMDRMFVDDEKELSLPDRVAALEIEALNDRVAVLESRMNNLVDAINSLRGFVYPSDVDVIMGELGSIRQFIADMVHDHEHGNYHQYVGTLEQTDEPVGEGVQLCFDGEIGDLRTIAQILHKYVD